MEGFEAYISNTGYLIIPSYNINFLISFSESSIPSMPETVEATAKPAGTDGDIVLNTTYEPIPFNIVCYTEDNLSVSNKILFEQKLNNFLNTIKNSTIKLGFQAEQKFYNVKYSGALNTTRYPAHLRFEIPLKSSESYAKDITEKTITGNGSLRSNTIKDVGAVFTINGPATTPKISFNNYEMQYDRNLLQGEKLTIDSKKSTITHTTSSNVSTNAMRYYNHQFPKVENGTNTLAIISGINTATQVNVKWYDLKF